jgi:hypothetical protein
VRRLVTKPSPDRPIPERVFAMKDLRCLLGLHKWRKRQIEGSQYLACGRCNKERDTVPSGPSGRGFGGIT